MNKYNNTGQIILAIAVVLIASFIIGSIIEKSIRDKETDLLEKTTWEYDFSASKLNGITSEIEGYFKEALSSSKEYKLDLITLLGIQTVEGKNYLYFAKGTKDKEEQKYYIVKVHVDTNKKVKLEGVHIFTIEMYADKDITNNRKILVGAWSAYNRTSETTLPNDVKKVYDEAIKKYTTAIFKPIAYLGTRAFQGHDYAILAVGTKTTIDSVPEIYMITIYKDTDDNTKVGKVAYIDLSKFE